MPKRAIIGYEPSVEASNENELEDAVIDEEVERERQLRPGVEQEIQARVDYADEEVIENRLFGQTLEEEERMRAREWEIERTRVRWDRGQESNREARCREVVIEVNEQRRRVFNERAASVDPWADPDRVDAREQLSTAELATVNQAAKRLAGRLNGFSTAAISRLVARRVVDGLEVTSAVLATMEELQTAPGQLIPIALVSEVARTEVDIEGVVVNLWEPSHPSIRQVGLLADDSGRIKFTSWRKSRQPIVQEGEVVRFREAAKSWYQGRVSVALTRSSRVIKR